MSNPMGHVEATLKANMLRYQCGQAIFCPGCNDILDCTRAVSTDIYRGEELVKTFILCGKCFDKREIPKLIESAIAKAAAKGVTNGRVEYTDGRELHKAGMLGDGDEHGLPTFTD